MQIWSPEIYFVDAEIGKTIRENRKIYVQKNTNGTMSGYDDAFENVIHKGSYEDLILVEK